MGKKLQDYFPNIRTRQEVLDEIHSDEELLLEFETWSQNERERFLDFCTGVRGLKILADGFIKELLNPEIHPERLESFLSLLLKHKVRICFIYQNDSGRIADESSLLITDIVVELEDGSLANVEIQRIGYMFPGQRCACYSSDLLLRQYKRVRANRKSKFTYRDIKTVYTIVLFEKSTKEFKEFPKTYIHQSKQVFNTGLKLDLLQEFILIPLDIFRKFTENKTITTELEAWLTFLSSDNPQKVFELMENFPKFQSLYEQAYEICLNMKEVMGMFSKELRELDRNTEQYMIEVMQDEIDAAKAELESNKAELESTKLEIESTKAELNANKAELDANKAELDASKAELDASKAELDASKAELDASKAELDEKNAAISNQAAEIAALKRELELLKK